MQIHHPVPVEGDIAALLTVHPRLVKRSQPVCMVVLQQRQFILPVKLHAEARLRRKPLSHCHIHAKRLSVRKHIRKIITIRVLQRHVQIHLHIPVTPETIRPHTVKVALLLRVSHLKPLCMSHPHTAHQKQHGNKSVHHFPHIFQY